MGKNVCELFGCNHGECIHYLQRKFPNYEHASTRKPPKPPEHDKLMSGVIQKLIGNLSCRRQPGPPPALPPTPFHGRQHDFVNLVELALLKFGRCHHCCIGIKRAKRKGTGFGCRNCVKRLCHSGCHEQYHRQKNIFYGVSRLIPPAYIRRVN